MTSKWSRDRAKNILKQMKFRPCLNQQVDMSKIKLESFKFWIQKKLKEILSVDDDVLVNFVYNQLDVKNPNPKEIQMNLSGFLQLNNAMKFVAELWTLLLQAQDSPSGIPESLRDERKEEAAMKRVEENAEREILECEKENNRKMGKSKLKMRKYKDHDRSETPRPRSRSKQSRDRKFRSLHREIKMDCISRSRTRKCRCMDCKSRSRDRKSSSRERGSMSNDRKSRKTERKSMSIERQPENTDQTSGGSKNIRSESRCLDKELEHENNGNISLGKGSNCGKEESTHLNKNGHSITRSATGPVTKLQARLISMADNTRSSQSRPRSSTHSNSRCEFSSTPTVSSRLSSQSLKTYKLKKFPERCKNKTLSRFSSFENKDDFEINKENPIQRKRSYRLNKDDSDDQGERTRSMSLAKKVAALRMRNRRFSRRRSASRSSSILRRINRSRRRRVYRGRRSSSSRPSPRKVRREMRSPIRKYNRRSVSPEWRRPTSLKRGTRSPSQNRKFSRSRNRYGHQRRRSQDTILRSRHRILRSRTRSRESFYMRSANLDRYSASQLQRDHGRVYRGEKGLSVKKVERSINGTGKKVEKANKLTTLSEHLTGGLKTKLTTPKDSWDLPQYELQKNLSRTPSPFLKENEFPSKVTTKLKDKKLIKANVKIKSEILQNSVQNPSDSNFTDSEPDDKFKGHRKKIKAKIISSSSSDSEVSKNKSHKGRKRDSSKENKLKRRHQRSNSRKITKRKKNYGSPYKSNRIKQISSDSDTSDSKNKDESWSDSSDVKKHSRKDVILKKKKRYKKKRESSSSDKEMKSRKRKRKIHKKKYTKTNKKYKKKRKKWESDDSETSDVEVGDENELREKALKSMKRYESSDKSE